MTPFERAAAFGGEYLRTPDFEGVIFPEGFGRHPDEEWYPYWTPTREVVLAAEARLPFFLREISVPLCVEWWYRFVVPKILAALTTYRRQYTGIIHRDAPALLVNCFPADGFGGDWLKWSIEVDDGGHHYFQAVYSPDAGDFVALWINGEA